MDHFSEFDSESFREEDNTNPYRPSNYFPEFIHLPLEKKIRRLKCRAKQAQASFKAQEWWQQFELENSPYYRPLILRTLEELCLRNGTIEEFYRAYLYSGSENILENLHFIDFLREARIELVDDLDDAPF